VFLAILDILPLDADPSVTVRTRLFVRHAQRVQDFVQSNAERLTSLPEIHRATEPTSVTIVGIATVIVRLYEHAVPVTARSPRRESAVWDLAKFHATLLRNPRNGGLELSTTVRRDIRVETISHFSVRPRLAMQIIAGGSH